MWINSYVDKLICGYTHMWIDRLWLCRHTRKTKDIKDKRHESQKTWKTEDIPCRGHQQGPVAAELGWHKSSVAHRLATTLEQLSEIHLSLQRIRVALWCVEVSMWGKHVRYACEVCMWGMHVSDNQKACESEEKKRRQRKKQGMRNNMPEGGSYMYRHTSNPYM